MMKLSNKKSKTITLLFLILTGMLLVYPKESLAFSLTGLQLWFNRMVPTLLPFMILSGIMIRLNLTEHVVKIISPVLTPLLRISLNGLYAVTIGFLCGFPMGARVIAQLYASHKLSRAEASYLLAFCNNIGPIYFVSFVLPLFHQLCPSDDWPGTYRPLSFWHVRASPLLWYLLKIYLLPEPYPYALYPARAQTEKYSLCCRRSLTGISAGHPRRLYPVRPVWNIQAGRIHGSFQSPQPRSADIVQNNRRYRRRS